MEQGTKKYLALSILSIAFLQTMTTSAISPTLGRMAIEFAGTAMSTIQLSMTISSICTIFMSLVIATLLARFSVKALMTLGITLYLIGGVGGFFSATLPQLLALRVVLGIGLGLFSPLLPIAVSQQYEGTPRSRMMGYTQSANFLGGIAGTVLAGFIAETGWRSVHLLYGVAALSLLFTIFFFPSASPRRAPTASGTPTAPKGRLPLLSFGLGLCMLMHALVFFKAPLSLAMFFPSIGLDSTAFSGNASGFLYALSFLSGMLFVPVTKLLKKMVFPATFLIMALAYFLLSQANSAATVYFATALLGLGAGIFIPSLFNKVPEVIPGPHIPQTMVIVNCGLFLGIFLSPYFSALVKSLGSGSYAFDYLVGAVMELMYMVIALALVFMPKRSTATAL